MIIAYHIFSSFLLICHPISAKKANVLWQQLGIDLNGRSTFSLDFLDFLRIVFLRGHYSRNQWALRLQSCPPSKGRLSGYQIYTDKILYGLKGLSTTVYLTTHGGCFLTDRKFLVYYILQINLYIFPADLNTLCTCEMTAHILTPLPFYVCFFFFFFFF